MTGQRQKRIPVALQMFLHGDVLQNKQGSSHASLRGLERSAGAKDRNVCAIRTDHDGFHAMKRLSAQCTDHGKGPEKARLLGGSEGLQGMRREVKRATNQVSQGETSESVRPQDWHSGPLQLLRICTSCSLSF
jgi:hypothetical protein